MADETASNREWVFKTRPASTGFARTDFELRRCDVPCITDGQVLLRLHLLSMDPTMRNAMSGQEAASRTEGSMYYSMMNWQPGTVPVWMSVAQVVESQAKGLLKGDFVLANAPWKEFVALEGKEVQKLPNGVTPAGALSAIGLTARTGYLGAKYIGQPKAGDVAFVSGAAGATGLVACQTFKNLGCSRVVGSAGSDDKVQLLKSIGVDAFNYKTESVYDGLRRLCPGGVNVAFDNVGGETLEALLEMMNDEGTVVLCGAISQYDKAPEQRYGVRNLFHSVAKRLKLQGFVVSFSFSEAQQADCTKTLQAWLRGGKIQDISTFVDGFENVPDGILSLFSGANVGKCLVRVPLLRAAL